MIRQALADLDRFGARAALVGGFAVSARARPRTTKDVDFSVAVDDDREAEGLVRNLIGIGYRAKTLLEHEVTGRLATVRLFLPESQSTEPDLDLLFASCGFENEVVAAATMMSLPGVGPVRIARTGHLIAMKVLAESDAREHDRADLRALVAAARAPELELARQAMRLIEQRGYARGKNLGAVLEQFVGGSPGSGSRRRPTRRRP
ncbi:MAG: nucleotidyl transferase AbiEii/AbiGii toxin family protein [Planctomycetota bacterium]